jgi:hypothetical protein
MTTYTELKQALAEREALSKVITQLSDQFLSEVAPYKVGDIVDCQGYSYKGKKVKINEIRIVIDRNMLYDIKVYATVLKKDGSESGNYTDWSKHNDLKIREILKNYK